MRRAPRTLARLALLVPALGLAVAPGAPAGAASPQPVVRDLVITVRDLDISVGDVEGAQMSTESPQQIALTFNADVLFAFDKADVNPTANDRLAAAADEIKQRAKTDVHIDGYTDAVGDDAYNLDLSRRRAEAVDAALRPLLAGSTVKTIVGGHGSADPVAENRKPNGSDNPEGRAKNRRVVISFGK